MSRDVKIQKGIPGHIGTDRLHTSTWQTLHIDLERCSSFFRTLFTGMAVLYINDHMPQANPTRIFIWTRWGAICNKILKFGSTHHHPWFPGQCQRPPRNHSGPGWAIHRLFLQSSPIEIACWHLKALVISVFIIWTLA